jgi:hypothetical protein
MSIFSGIGNWVGGAWDTLTGQYDPSSVPNDQKWEADRQRGNAALLGKWATTGEGPSQAQALLDRNRGINAATQLGAAKSLGGDPALANRNAAEAISRGNADATFQSGIIRTQEQQQAMQNYINALNATRAQDLGYQNALWNIGQGNAQRSQDFWQGILTGGAKWAGGMSGGGGGAAAGGGAGGGGASGAGMAGAAV